MVSKWRGELETGKGDIEIGLRAETTKSRSKLSPTSTNPETNNEIKQEVVDEETGQVVGRSYRSCGKKIEIGEEEIFFDKGEWRELKKTVVTDGFDVQKVIDREELDIAQVKDTAFHLTPEEGFERKYSLIWSGLQQTSKVIVVKYSPRTSENLYAMWSDERGLWLSEIVYPENFEIEEIEAPDLKEEIEEKAVKLIEEVEERHKDNEIVDNQRKKLEEAIEKKMNGEELDVQAEQEKAEEQELEEELEAVL